MLLHAVKREPRSFIVPGGGPVNVPMSPVSQPRLVRDALAADAIVAVAREHAAVPVDPRTIASRLECFRDARSNPACAPLNDAALRSEHNQQMYVDATLAAAVASLERYATISSAACTSSPTWVARSFTLSRRCRWAQSWRWPKHRSIDGWYSPR